MNEAVPTANPKQSPTCPATLTAAPVVALVTVNVAAPPELEADSTDAGFLEDGDEEVVVVVVVVVDEDREADDDAAVADDVSAG